MSLQCENMIIGVVGGMHAKGNTVHTQREREREREREHSNKQWPVHGSAPASQLSTSIICCISKMI